MTDNRETQNIDFNKINELTGKAGGIFKAFDAKIMMIFYGGTAVLLNLLFWFLPAWSFGWASTNAWKFMTYFPGTACGFFGMLASGGFIASVVLAFVRKRIDWWMPVATFVSLSLCYWTGVAPMVFTAYLVWLLSSAWAAFGVICNGRQVGFN